MLVFYTEAAPALH